MTKTRISERPKNKPQLVLRKTKSENLDVRRLSVSEVNLEQWNLCALLPVHPHFNTDRLKKISATYVALTFPSVEKRDSFSATLDRLLDFRIKQEKTLMAGLENARTMGNRINHVVEER